MGAGLVGDDVDRPRRGAAARGTPRRSCRPRRPTRPGDRPWPQGLLDRGVEVVGDLVEVAVLDPALQPGPVDVDDQADAVVEGDGQRLRAAHPAAAAGQGQRAGQGAAEPLLGDGGEGLVRALDDALGADVDPRPGGHLAVHGQPELLQPAELRPVGPVAAPGWSWRSAPAAPTRGSASPRPAGRTGPAWSRRPPGRAGCGPWRRTSASPARPGRCRRRRPGRRGARRSPGRGCSSASAAGPRWPSSWRSGWCRAVRGRGGRLP